MVYLLASGPLMELPDLEEFERIRPAMNNLLQDLGDTVIGFLTLLFAWKILRRMVRFAQI